MSKNTQTRDAFTLIEVMVAVLIISVVIMALIKMYANNTHIFISYKKQMDINQYSSFLIGNEKYSDEDKSISLYELVDDFDLHDNLRRELKDMKVKVVYSELERLDLSESDSNDEGMQAAGLVLEIGKSSLRTEDSSLGLFRFKLQ